MSNWRSFISSDEQLSGYFESAGDGAWTGHLLDHFGCVGFGESFEDVTANLAYTAGEYFAWLRFHGEANAVRNSPPQILIAEIVENVATARRSGEPVAIFSPELEPATNVQIRRTIQLLGYCQADLDRILRNVPNSALEFRLHPGHRSVREIALHIGQAECWYLTRLEPMDDPHISALYDRLNKGNLLDRLREVAETAAVRFHGWTDTQRAFVFVPRHHARYGDERWTARKVLRRFIEHRREHIDEILRTLAAAGR